MAEDNLSTEKNLNSDADDLDTMAKYGNSSITYKPMLYKGNNNSVNKRMVVDSVPSMFASNVDTPMTILNKPRKSSLKGRIDPNK